jgi:hypothetical protein
MLKNKFGFMIMAAIVCALVWAVPASAQQHQQGQQGTPQQQIEVKDGELEKVAAAYVEVAQIQKEFQKSLQKAPDPDQRQALQQDANQEMIQAVEGEGVSVDRYSRIITSVNSDENLRQKFMKKIQNLQR